MYKIFVILTCLNQTWKKTEFCINQTLNKVQIHENLTRIN